MKICLVVANFWPGWGGAERQCQLLARTLTRYGHEVVVLTRGQAGLPAAERIDGVAVRRAGAFGNGILRSLVWTLTATAWLRRHGRQFQIIQCYQLLSPSHVGLLGRCRENGQATILRPACSGPYGDVAEVSRLPLTEMRRRLLRTADAFVTLTGAIEAELSAFGITGVPFYRIPNGVDSVVFSPATAEERKTLRARFGLPAERVLCAFVGRLTPQKNPELLIEAWSRCSLSQATLVIVGDGPLRSRLEQRAGSLPASGHVRFTGAITDVAAFVRATDLVVLPSSAEGMSNAMLEAMACGVPVIATDVGGIQEMLGGGGRAGWVVPADAPEALATAITTAMGSAELRREVGAVARGIALERYDIRRVASQHLAAYAELLSRPGSGGPPRD